MWRWTHTGAGIRHQVIEGRGKCRVEWIACVLCRYRPRGRGMMRDDDDPLAFSPNELLPQPFCRLDMNSRRVPRVKPPYEVETRITRIGHPRLCRQLCEGGVAVKVKIGPEGAPDKHDSAKSQGFPLQKMTLVPRLSSLRSSVWRGRRLTVILMVAGDIKDGRGREFFRAHAIPLPLTPVSPASTIASAATSGWSNCPKFRVKVAENPYLHSHAPYDGLRLYYGLFMSSRSCRSRQSWSASSWYSPRYSKQTAPSQAMAPQVFEDFESRMADRKMTPFVGASRGGRALERVHSGRSVEGTFRETRWRRRGSGVSPCGRLLRV